MMATSMGPNFQGHPANMGHPGVAGHPMGPGMNANGGQPGTPGGGMPHQFAGNPMAAGNPGMNPAMMAAMQQHSGGHNLQANFPHMSSAQQQAYQQQFTNPQAVAQMRQQQVYVQQQRQALMAQQAMAQNGGMAPNQMAANGMTANGMTANGMTANGMPMNIQLTPQQMQQLRQGGRLNAMQHPQAHAAIMAQQLALQQHAAQNQMQQGGPNAQQMQMNAQALQHLQQQQQQAQAAQAAQAAHAAQAVQAQQQQQQIGPGAQAQMAVQQGQQQGPQGQQNQQGQQPGQPGQQPPGQGQPGQQAQVQAQQQAQQQAAGQAQQRQQTPAQGSQAGTPAPTGQHTPQQTPAPGPNVAQTPQGQPQQNPGQPPQGQQQQPGHQPQQQPQPQHAMLAQHMNAATAQQLAMNSSMLQQQRREHLKAQCLMRLSQLSEQLSGYPGARSRDDLSYWNDLVARFFSRTATFRHTLHTSAEGEDTGPRQYDISFPAIARYFHTHFGSGVKSMQLTLGQGTADRPLPGDAYHIENPRASFIYWFETGSHLVSSGSLRVLFDSEQKFELFEFLATSHEEFVARKQVIDAAKPAHVWMKEWHKVNSTDSKQSPEMSKKGKGKQLKSPQREPPEVLNDLPDSAVNRQGVTEAVYQFLEIVEVMGQMNPLFNFTHSNPGLGPYAALDQYVSTFINAGHVQMNGQVPQGAPRTPSFSQFNMGASPAAANMNLPGSPHVGSPAPGQIQAPGMQLQQSQQGTSSSGPSANTSPASNKRRRPSTVKMEEDGPGAGTPGAQVNGTANRNKPATPRMPKRVKANPS